jgi:ACS family hexuronate transporter-like MFS transporter
VTAFAALLRRNLRWRIIALIFVGTVLNYIARNSLGVLAPVLQRELGITTAQYSYIVGAFQLAYTLMLPVCGMLMDRIGLRTGFAIFATIWSLSNMGNALAAGWLSLVVLRFILGMSEAAVIPAGVKASTEWFPPRQRSMAIGWINIGTALGAALAVPLVSALALWFDWRAAFFVTGAVGLVWAGIWYLTYRTPAEHPRLTPEERELIGETESAVSPKLSWARVRSLFSSPTFWTIAVPRFLAEPAWQTFNFWIPLFFVRVHGYDLKDIAWFAWMPFLAADLGGLCGGYISPTIARIFGTGLIRSRVIGVALAATLMIAPASAGFLHNPHAAIAMLCIGGFAHQTLSVLINTLTADCYSSNEVGMANGFVSQAGWIGGFLFSLAIGQLADRIGFTPLFAALGVFDILGAVILIVFIRHLVPVKIASAARS